MAEEGKGSPSRPEDIAAATLEFEKYVERQKESIRIERERLQLQGQYVDAFGKQFSMQEKTISALAESLDILEEKQTDPNVTAEQFKNLTDEMLKTAESAGLFGDELQELKEFLNSINDGTEITKESLKKMQVGLHKADKRFRFRQFCFSNGRRGSNRSNEQSHKRNLFDGSSSNKRRSRNRQDVRSSREINI